MKPLALFVSLMMCSPLAAVADEVSDLIQQLDAPNFQDREQAAQKLQAQGKPVIPALSEAAETGNLETAVRSIQILQNLMESKDKPAAVDAKAALEKLADSNNASTARRAKSALAPKPRPAPAPIRNRAAVPPFGLPAGVRANGIRRIHVRTVNGVKTLEAQNGDKSVKIEVDAQGAIQIESTEKKNGKDVTEKFAAKNVDELKKNNPKGHEVYQQYERYLNRVGARFGGAGGGGFGGRGGFGGPADPLATAERNLRTLNVLLQRMETSADDNAIKDATNESRESLKKEIVEMKKRLTEIENRLQKAIDADAKHKSAEAEKPANAQK